MITTSYAAMRLSPQLFGGPAYRGSGAWTSANQHPDQPDEQRHAQQRRRDPAHAALALAARRRQAVQPGRDILRLAEAGTEIGRASCKERVWISVGAG